jgi:hypothetical protein
MSTSIRITGTYSQKTEIFGRVISHHTGTFDVTKEVGDSSWSEPLGPFAKLTESIRNGQVVLSVTAFGQAETLFTASLHGEKKFKIELDRGNFVEGKAAVVMPVAGAAVTSG